MTHKSILLPLMCSVVLILLTAGGYWWLKRSYEQTQAELLQAERAYQQTLKRSDNADQDARIYQQYEDRFSFLLEKSIINDENREALMSDVLQATKKAEVFDTRINMLPQIVIQTTRDQIGRDKNHSSYFTRVQWRESLQTLEFYALHEGDFLALVDLINQQLKPHQFVECTLKRDKLELRPDAKNVFVQCKLNWLSIYFTNKKTGNAK